MVEKKVQVDTKTKVKKKSFSAKLTDEQNSMVATWEVHLFKPLLKL